jgi:hypothetical protein
MNKQNLKVPVGATTVAGYTATITAAATAVLAYLFADADQATLGTIVAGAVALSSLLVTQIGRYAQAHALAKQAPALALQASAQAGVHVPDSEPRSLTDDELEEDPDMGDPPDVGPESYQADPDDTRGGHDLPKTSRGRSKR